MLKISRKEDYGVLMMSIFATTPMAIVPLRTIARQHHVPLAFAQQIASQLRQNGLLKSKEGVSGGFMLARPAAKITLQQILEALGQRIELTRCTGLAVCPLKRWCPTHQPWERIHKIIHQLFSSITLEQLQAG